VASVAEVKAAIDAALSHVQDGQAAVRAASDRLSEAQQTLAVAVEGSGHDCVSGARAALSQAAAELDDALSATHQAVEQAQSYAAAL
jgi:ABC-type transporter Mla subunit MlaD